MRTLTALLITLSLTGQSFALSISISPVSFITTQPERVIRKLFPLLSHDEENLLELARIFASNEPFHTAWRKSCRKWTPESFLEIQDIITSSPNSPLLQSFLLDPWCIKGLNFGVDSNALSGLFGGLPTKSSRRLKSSVSLVEGLDVYGLWRRNITLLPDTFRVFDNVPLHRLIDPYQAARNGITSFQSLLFDYGRKKLRQSDFDAVTGTIFLLIFPMTRPAASDIAQALMRPGDPEEDQFSFEEVLDICRAIASAGEITPLHSIAKWIIKSGILQEESNEEVFPSSSIDVDSTHEVLRLSLLLALLSGAPSEELAQILQARLQKCPIIEYIELLFVISWTRPTSGLFDMMVGDTRSRLIGLSPRLLGKSKSVIISQLTTGEKRQMFRDSVRTFADDWYSVLLGKTLASKLAHFYKNVGFNLAPPVDFLDVQQFLINLLESSLTGLTDLRVTIIEDQRTITFKGVKRLRSRWDIYTLSLIFYLWLHFEEVPPVIISPEVRSFICNASHKSSWKRLSRANYWV